MRRLLRRLLPYSMRYRLHRLLRDAAAARKRRRAFTGRRANFRDVERFCLENAAPVTQPLVLISQVQRSGGTLLSKLFDGHPELLSHPQELKIGYPHKWIWPDLDRSQDPEQWFSILFENTTIDLVERGYSKGRQETRRFPFFLVPSLQRRIFVSRLQNRPVSTQREILDAYFTSYFNAWLNRQGKIPEARYVTGFVPRLANDPQNVAKFFATYPDGYLIQIVRSPYSWVPSARRHVAKRHLFGALEDAMAQWKASAGSILANRELSDRVIVLDFDDLVLRTEEIMRCLCQRLGIAFHPSLLIPTYNGEPIKANSSFQVESAGVMAETVQRDQDLSDTDRSYIAAQAEALYESVRAARSCTSPPAGAPPPTQ